MILKTWHAVCIVSRDSPIRGFLESIMAKLSKKEREDIASLFNSIVVANMLIEEALKENNSEKFNLWWESHKRDTIELFKEYGIELPALQNYLNNAA